MNNVFALGPLLVIVAGALLILLLEAFLHPKSKTSLGYLALLFLILNGALCVAFWNAGYIYFGGSLFLDKLSLVLTLILTVTVCLIVLTSLKYILLQDANYGEFYALLLLALSGMMIMVSTNSLLVIFLGLEVLSVSSYALAGLRREDQKSSEAAVKYFLLGSFASAFFVFGLAMLFGRAGSIEIPAVIEFLRGQAGLDLMALFGLALIIISVGFKIAFVPFHMWTPDVYQGAPTPVTAFYSVGTKAVGLIVLVRLLYSYWSEAFKSQPLFWILWAISALTMVVGNLMALRQTNLKRILAYSSIAHAGYLLVAILARDTGSLVFYLAAYLFMNIGAFAAVMAMSKKSVEYLELEDYSGIGFKYPWIGATFSVFLLSLAGFPPTGGFLAKFFVFSSAVRQGLVPLVIIAVLASLVSVFYYLRIVVYMYMRPASREIDINLENPALYLVLFLCLYGVLQLGLFPGNVLVFIKQAVAALPVF
jgi:NADH-quinone oxidoreductase subunit N